MCISRAARRGQSADDAWREVVAWITQSDEWRVEASRRDAAPPRGCAAPMQLDRGEFLQAMQRLDVFYRAPDGLQRPDGLSIDGAPDFLGIAAWIFDVYLNARLAAAAADAAWTRGRPEHRGVRRVDAQASRRVRDRALRRHRRLRPCRPAGARRVAARQELEGRLHRHDRRQQLHDRRRVDDRREHRPVLRGLHLSVRGRLPVVAASSNRFFPTLGNHDWETPARRRISTTSRCPATSATTMSFAIRCTCSRSTATRTSPTAPPRRRCRRSGCRVAWPRPRRRSVSSCCTTRRSRPGRMDRMSRSSGRIEQLGCVALFWPGTTTPTNGSSVTAFRTS